jgi:hypothetical protein
VSLKPEWSKKHGTRPFGQFAENKTAAIVGICRAAVKRKMLFFAVFWLMGQVIDYQPGPFELALKKSRRTRQWFIAAAERRD